MTRQFTLMMYTEPHAWSRADLTHSRAWPSTRLVTAVQLTTGLTRRTRLAARRLHTSDYMSQTSASENTNATWRIQWYKVTLIASSFTATYKLITDYIKRLKCVYSSIKNPLQSYRMWSVTCHMGSHSVTRHPTVGSARH